MSDIGGERAHIPQFLQGAGPFGTRASMIDRLYWMGSSAPTAMQEFQLKEQMTPKSAHSRSISCFTTRNTPIQII